jgi:hypothetical protein
MPAMMRRIFILAGLAVSVLLAGPAGAQSRSDLIAAALRICAANFGKPSDLARTFSAAGWRREAAIETPIYVFTADRRHVIAAFTRSGARQAACMAAADKMSFEDTRALAQAHVAESQSLEPHPSEKLTWIWKRSRTPVWFGLTEERKDFSIFRAYAILYGQR